MQERNCPSYSLKAHLQCCAGTMLLASMKTVWTSKAGSLGRTTWARWLRCTAASPDLGTKRGICCAKWRHYIQEVVNRRGPVQREKCSSVPMCLNIKGFVAEIINLKRCSKHYWGFIHSAPLMQNYTSDTGLTASIRKFGGDTLL